MRQEFYLLNDNQISNSPWAATYSVVQSFLTYGIAKALYLQKNDSVHLKSNSFIYALYELHTILHNYAVELKLTTCKYPYIPTSVPIELLPRQRIFLFLLIIARLKGIEYALKCLNLMWQEGWLIEGCHFYDYLWKYLQLIRNYCPAFLEDVKIDKDIEKTVDERCTGIEEQDIYSYFEAKKFHLLSIFAQNRLNIEKQKSIIDILDLPLDLSKVDLELIIALILKKAEDDYKFGKAIHESSKTMQQWIDGLFRVGLMCGNSLWHTIYNILAASKKISIAKKVEDWNRGPEELFADSLTTLTLGPLSGIDILIRDLRELYRKGDRKKVIRRLKFENFRLRTPKFFNDYILENLDVLEDNYKYCKILSALRLTMGPGYIMCYFKDWHSLNTWFIGEPSQKDYIGKLESQTIRYDENARLLLRIVSEDLNIFLPFKIM